MELRLREQDAELLPLHLLCSLPRVPPLALEEPLLGHRVPLVLPRVRRIGRHADLLLQLAQHHVRPLLLEHRRRDLGAQTFDALLGQRGTLGDRRRRRDALGRRRLGGARQRPEQVQHLLLGVHHKRPVLNHRLACIHPSVHPCVCECVRQCVSARVCVCVSARVHKQQAAQQQATQRVLSFSDAFII